MEIGSFIEMQFPKGKEYYSGNNIARLNSGRAGIYHAIRCSGCDTVYLPHYQCKTVRDFLIKKGINIKYYHIDASFCPILDRNDRDTCIVIVNYYGIISADRLKKIARNFNNVIIDHSQAFFTEPIEECYNVYSVRKFIGVPDGAYVIGENSVKFLNEYDLDYSSDTADFLLKRIEYGCEGRTYESRMKNEARIDASDIRIMSKLTRAILDGTDYSFIAEKRRMNFETTCSLFDHINQINVRMFYDDTCVPMVYPLVIENDSLLNKLLEAKHFQGHWWSYLLDEVDKSSFAYWLSRYMVPITIDQRYGRDELEYTAGLITGVLDGR